MTPTKEDSFPLTDTLSLPMDVFNFPDKRIQNSYFKEAQGTTNNKTLKGQFNEIRKTIHKQNEKFNRDSNCKKEPKEF